MDINEMYEKVMQPSYLVKHIHDFKEYLKEATCLKDLYCILKAYEEDELYEECIIIKEEIENYNE